MSNGNGIAIDVVDLVSAPLALLTAGLEDLASFNAKLSLDELALIQRHLIGIALDRHDSARRLGAEPSGFWAEADKQSVATSDGESATVSITHPGIGRVAHDVDIVPGAGKQWLTIPLEASAYGERAYRMSDLFFVQPTGKEHALLGRRTGKGKGEVEWLYLLLKSVHLPQDRTLLPPDEAFAQVARLSAAEFVQAILDGRIGG